MWCLYCWLWLNVFLKGSALEDYFLVIFLVIFFSAGKVNHCWNECWCPAQQQNRVARTEAVGRGGHLL
jgi:hypothetical protein